MLCMMGCATMATSAQNVRLPAADVPATDPPAPTDAVKTPPVAGEVRKIDEDQYLIGGVTIRKSTREISFDAVINQDGGLIEFLLVTEKGKVHESLFSCAIRPTDLNVAFKLLAYPASPELFQILAPDQRPTGKYPEVAEEVKTGARLAISACWQDGGNLKVRAVNELVKNSTTEAPMPPGPWLYTGSLIHQGAFRAEVTGDIIAVFSNPTAMINYPGDSRTSDEVWWVNPGTTPAKGTPVRITIKPISKITPATKKTDPP
jgi:hypothetical protein